MLHSFRDCRAGSLIAGDSLLRAAEPENVGSVAALAQAVRLLDEPDLSQLRRFAKQQLSTWDRHLQKRATSCAWLPKGGGSWVMRPFLRKGPEKVSTVGVRGCR